MAMCLSAFAQRPPKGYNYAYVDFNGDGKKEYVYFIPPKDADRWEELDDFESLYGVLKFTNPSIPSIKVKQCVSGVPQPWRPQWRRKRRNWHSAGVGDFKWAGLPHFHPQAHRVDRCSATIHRVAWR